MPASKIGSSARSSNFEKGVLAPNSAAARSARPAPLFNLSCAEFTLLQILLEEYG